jgi:mannose-6-phosphate isomerase
MEAAMETETPDPTGAFDPTRVEKPWGHELIWAHTDQYVGKVLHVRAGHSLSLQYHEVKDETIHMLRGQMRFWIGPDADSLEEVELGEGASYRIRPGIVHRMQAVTDVDILEVSTPHLGDVVRIEDRYGRT